MFSEIVLENHDLETSLEMVLEIVSVPDVRKIILNQTPHLLGA